MKFKNLSNVSHQKLLVDFSGVVLREREAITDVILYISEMRVRKLYAEEGFSSLFSFLTQKYAYSVGAAYRRIQASKVYDLFPEVLEFIHQGKLNLVSLSLIEPHLTKENGKELIQEALGKNKEEIECLISQHFGKVEKSKDKIRRLAVIVPSVSKRPEVNLPLKQAQEMVQEPESSMAFSLDMHKNVEFVCDEEVATMIERAKVLFRHKYPQGKLEDLMKEAFLLLLQKKDPIQRGELLKKRESVQKKERGEENLKSNDSTQKSRYIPTSIRGIVWKRDKERCQYQSPQGKVCGERSFLQMDHVKPWGLGGDSTPQNLRLLCSVHNRLRAEKTFLR